MQPGIGRRGRRESKPDGEAHAFPSDDSREGQSQGSKTADSSRGAM